MAETFHDPGFVSELVVRLESFSPVGVTFAPDGRLFIWDKAGVVRIFKPPQNGQPGELLSTPFIDIRSQVNQFWDRGLLGMALDPNFDENGFIYLLYTFQNGGDPFDAGPKTARLTRITADPDNPDTALSGSEVVLLGSIEEAPCDNYPAGSDCIPNDGPGHAIGALRFAPDGKLFVSIGDGASPDIVDPRALRAQRLDSYAGKLLRINPDGSPPGDNPFDDGTDSIQSRVYAFGLRNPFRFNLDQAGEPYIADVGWITFEEVNRGRGANFGWPCYEGDAPTPEYQAAFQECQSLGPDAVVPPFHFYAREEGVTVIGGPFYTATAYPPQYRNNYFLADYDLGWIRRIVLAPDQSLQAVEEFVTDVKGIVHLELGPDGLLYYVNIVTGEVRRIRSGLSAVASAAPKSGHSPLTVRFSSEGSKDSAGGRLSYLWDFGDGSPPSTERGPSHVYRTSGVTTFTATLTTFVLSGPNQGVISSTRVPVIVNSKPPTPTILSPADGAAVVVGQTVGYRGTAKDVDGEAVTLTWRVLLHHDTHVHTFTGATGEEGSFVVEDHGAGVYKYEIILTATDASGLSASKSVILPVGQPASPSPSPGAGTVQFNPATLTVVESAGQALLTVTRTGGAASEAGAFWEITGGDAIYGLDFGDPVNGQLTFGAGLLSQQIALTLLNPSEPHGPRSLVVTLRQPSGGVKLGVATATVTIVDEVVSFEFSQAAYSVSEGTGAATITVRRNGPATTAVSVGYESGPDGTAVPTTHYTPVNGVLNFGVGQTSRTFTVPLKNNAVTEPGRTVQLRLKDPSGGTALSHPDAVVLTINDNDPAGVFRFSAGASTVTEGASLPVLVNVTVTRSGGSGGGVTVRWRITGGTAVVGDVSAAGVDVVTPTSGVLTFGPGVTSRVIPVQIDPDSDVEPNETLLFALGAPSPAGTIGSPATATLVIVDRDRVGTFQFASAAPSVPEGIGAASVTVTRTGPTTQQDTVDWAITGGTAMRGDSPGPGVDYVSAAGGTVTFPVGQASAFIPLTLLGDADLEGNETITLALQDPSTGWALGLAATTVTLVEGTVQFQTATPSVNESSGSATIAVTRAGLTTRPATVQYTVGPGGTATAANPATACQPGADYRPGSGVVTFGPGQTSRTFVVPICSDTGIEASKTIEMSLSNPIGPVSLGTVSAATLTLVDNDLAGAFRFSSAAYSASETQPSVTVTVVRTSTGGGASVDWAIVGGSALDGTDYSGPTTGTLTFGAGQTTRSLVIPLLNDLLTDGAKTLMLELSHPQPAGLATLGTVVQTTVTLGDNEPVLRLSAQSYAASEGSAFAPVTILRSGATTGTSLVTVVPLTTSAATGGTCGAGTADFSDAMIPVTFTPGQTSKTVLVPLCPDSRAEGPESFTVELWFEFGASLGFPPGAVITLADNDVGGTFKWSAAQVSGVEGSTVALTVTRTGGVASDVTVTVATQDGDEDGRTANAVAGTDYTALAPTVLTFNAGVTSQTVEIPLLTPGGPGPRVFRVQLQDPEGGASLGSPSTALVWTLN